MKSRAGATSDSRARSAALLEHYCGVVYTLCGDERDRRDILDVEAAPGAILAAMAAHADAPVLLEQCFGALTCLGAAGARARERVCRSMMFHYAVVATGPRLKTEIVKLARSDGQFRSGKHKHEWVTHCAAAAAGAGAPGRQF